MSDSLHHDEMMEPKKLNNTDDISNACSYVNTHVIWCDADDNKNNNNF